MDWATSPEPSFLVTAAGRSYTGLRRRREVAYTPALRSGYEGRGSDPYGAWVFSDSNAHDRGEDPQHLYSVRFEGRELWGEAAEPGTCVHLDLFESYLEPA